jgi:hypothetical protein
METPTVRTSSWIAAVTVVGSLFGASLAFAQTRLVSTAADGTLANGPSTHAALSTNGRYVAFTSSATNLVPGDTNGKDDVFVKDLQTGAITRVSVATGGEEFPFNSGFDRIDISADGNVVVFASSAPLAADDTNGGVDVYVRDRSAGTTTRVSVATGGAQGSGFSPSMSDDGRYVVFESIAPNLVAGDTNGLGDVFLHDRNTQATTRVSVSSQGTQATGTSRLPAISNNGEVIAFISNDPALGPGADPWNCTTGCSRPYVRTRVAGETSRIDPANGAPESSSFSLYNGVTSIELDATGRMVAMGTSVFPRIVGAGAITFDRQTQRAFHHDRGYVSIGPVALSGNGRFVVAPSRAELMMPELIVKDLRAGHSDEISGGGGVLGENPIQRAISFDGRYVVYSTSAPGEPGDTNSLRDIVMEDRDPDGDGMPTVWEQFFGLDPASAADATTDPDGDGQTSLEEFQAGAHPAGAHRSYLAEGAANSFFATAISIANPNAAPALVNLRLLGANDVIQSVPVTVAAFGHLRLDMIDRVPDQAFATTIESTHPVAVDRTMTWDIPVAPGEPSPYGSHAEAASAAPSTTWFLAEGATHGNFDLFYLLQNPADTQADVTVTYLREAPLAPVLKNYAVAPNSRRTIYVDTEGPELEAANVSASISSTQPIMVERAMYASRPGQPFVAGHAGAGVTSPALKWYLAEGATGPFFDLYLLIANPGTQPANVTVNYLLPEGAPPVVKTYTVDRQSRRTISVDFEDPLLANTPVGMVVESTNSQPVIVERAMWWPSPDWYEAHLVAGATVTGTRWALAGAKVGHSASEPRWAETYVLIANTSATAGTATITHLQSSATPRPTRTVSLPANGRVNVNLGDLFGVTPDVLGDFGVLVESNGVEIVVERATYSTLGGHPAWQLGAASLATRLQP